MSGCCYGMVIFKKTQQSLSLLHTFSDRRKEFVLGCTDPLFFIDRKMFSTNIVGNSQVVTTTTHSGMQALHCQHHLPRGRHQYCLSQYRKGIQGKWVLPQTTLKQVPFSDSCVKVTAGHQLSFYETLISSKHSRTKPILSVS